MPLVAVVAYVVIKGLPAWSVDFFTNPTYPEGIPGGGVANAIVGTAEIGLIATAVTVPLGLLCGLFLAESDGRVAAAVRFTADVMTGVPSITVGIFGYIAIVKNFRLQRARRRLRHRDHHAAGHHPGRGDGHPGRARCT